MLIGLTGKKRSGKDTIADYLVYNYDFKKLSFATPIKQMLKIIINDNKFTEDNKEEVIPNLGVNYRYLMQTLGTNWGRDLINDNLWINFLINEIPKHKLVVVSDIRFDNEAKAIIKLCGKIIKVERNIDILDDHISENDVDDKYISKIIYNDKSLKDLYINVESVLNVFTD
jgi:hypothetical protein